MKANHVYQTRYPHTTYYFSCFEVINDNLHPLGYR
nr:MAG TPA: hypothetical protein [Caudoviricetes sp.]